MLDENLLLMTDSYKLSHYVQYPRGTENVYSYLESRGGRFGQSVFFGLQYLLKKHLEGVVVHRWKINEAERLAKAHLGGENTFNRAGWEYIIDAHGGRLPLRIKAVKEGSLVPVRNVLMTVEVTDPKVYWLTNYLETLLVQLWYPITVATQSWHMKGILLDYLRETGDESLIDFKLHDFGFRGVSSVETAAIGGASHLVNFKGTDTIAGILMAQRYYDSEMPGFSIPASEHSTITSWGKDHESCAMKNMLKQYPTGMVACVSDSFDIYNACENIWGDQLRMEITKRDGTLVIRPDSGDPLVVLPRIMNILADKFGVTTNAKGYKVLNPKVRVIQGDGIDFDTMPAILEVLRQNGYSADNIAFGSGGGLLQKLNRDTMKFAFKCSSVVVEGEERDVYKQPITDAVKVSKKGRLKLVRQRVSHGSIYTTTRENENDYDDEMDLVFENGKIMREQNFESIRAEANNGMKYARYMQYNFGNK
mgnify:CR=1 FL=1